MENEKMDKVHKAIVDAVLITSAVCGGAAFAEFEIKHLIDYTKEAVHEVFSNGLTPEQHRARLEAQKKELSALWCVTKNPEFRSRLSAVQAQELDNVFEEQPLLFHEIVNNPASCIDWKFTASTIDPNSSVVTNQNLHSQPKANFIPAPITLQPPPLPIDTPSKNKT